MNNSDRSLVSIILWVIGCIMIVPVVVQCIIWTIVVISNMCSNLYSKVEFTRRMEKGIKDGTVVKIDGYYYAVEHEEIEDET